MEAQLPLLREHGALVIATGAPFVCFELDGDPRAKQRHRYRIIVPKESWKKPFAQEYTPEETVAYQTALGWQAKAAMAGRPPSDRPLALLVHVFKPVPVSWPAREKNAALTGALLPAFKPDWDNYGKITDALSGIVWKDDGQVVDGRVIKRYSEVPALRVEVREFVPPT